MAATCAKVMNAVCSRYLLTNRLTSLTVPFMLTHKHRDVLYQQSKHFQSPVPRKGQEKVVMYFLDRDGDRVEVSACVGDTLLDVAIKNDVELEGACEGTLACSTCHLIFKPEQYEQLPEPPTEEELDMLDLAFDLQETSRLGCQVTVTKNMEGWEIKVPAEVSDAREAT